MTSAAASPNARTRNPIATITAAAISRTAAAYATGVCNPIQRMSGPKASAQSPSAMAS